MLIISNKFLPLGKSFAAINLFGVVFTKRQLSVIDQNHEYIHSLQQRELLFVGFYLLYLLEWMQRLWQTRNLLSAYYCISFEKEAYAKQNLLDYRKTRRRYAWMNYYSLRADVRRKPRH